MPTLLSIQSHVVHGHVGNKSATFPLQLQGWDVLSLNTTQFSNHPGHGCYTGQKASASEISELLEGLAMIEMNEQIDVVLAGYVPSTEALKTVGEECSKLVSASTGVRWVLDPVLGDNGRLYVSEENIKVYCEILRGGLVQLVTPNQLELEVLSGVKVTDWQSLERAVKEFMKLYNVENLVVSSVELEDSKHLVSLCCTTNAASGALTASYYEVKKFQANFSGSGDLFCALLTSAWFSNGSLVEALGESLSIVEKVLELTYQHRIESLQKKGEQIPEKLIVHDLNIIGARDYFTQHLQLYKSKKFF